MNKRKVTNMVAVIAILIGCSVLLYPTISNYLARRNSSYSISGYEKALESMSREKQQEELQKVREYNVSLNEGSLRGDPFSGTADEEDREYEELLNPDHNGMMGYIRIPKIGVELPIYHGTEEKVLQKGIGHWKGSSLPVGGAGTHAVLTGHRGLPATDLFSDLDQMEEGDVFYLSVMGEHLAYKVDQIRTVLPDETESLQIEAGKDYVTLVTCTPYAVNTHRLLVRGQRVPYEEAVQTASDKTERKIWIPTEIKAVLCVLGIFLLIYGVYRFYKKRSKRRKRRWKR